MTKVASEDYGQLGGEHTSKVIFVNHLSFEVIANGRHVPLTRMEFDLLVYLMRHASRVVPHRELMEQVVRGSHQNDSSLLRVHLTHLRRKLGTKRAIETVRGRGFRFRGDRAEVGSNL